MAIVLFIGFTVLVCYLAYRLDLWKQLALTEEERYHEVLSQLADEIRDKVQAEDKLENMQKFLASIATRPIYAYLTNEQIQEIGNIVSSATTKKEYLN